MDRVVQKIGIDIPVDVGISCFQIVLDNVRLCIVQCIKAHKYDGV